MKRKFIRYAVVLILIILATLAAIFFTMLGREAEYSLVATGAVLFVLFASLVAELIGRMRRRQR